MGVTFMANLSDLTDEIRAFCRERDWQQFHTGKNLAISLTLEASELLELFQWSDLDPDQIDLETRTKLSHELADIFYWTLLISDKYNIDLSASLKAKLTVNAAKYPKDKSFGSSKKYTEL